jgi:serine/threonine-protein kinase
VIHRDIKPENVLVDGEGWVWVCDFGVAKAFGTLPLTDTGTTLGTPSYMSPEQCYGQALDPRSDQYSLAVLAYRCLAGETPFVTDSLGMMIRKHCLEPPPALADLRPDLPPRVSNTVLRGSSLTSSSSWRRWAGGCRSRCPTLRSSR